MHLFKSKREKDPVCGMDLSESTEYKSEYGGKTYLFCSEDCKNKFDSNPAEYIRNAN